MTDPMAVIEQIGRDQLAAVSVQQLERERDVYRAALERIAGAESGGWGRIAFQALREGRS